MRDRSAEAGDARRQAGEGAVRRSLGAEDALAATEAGGGAVSHAATAYGLKISSPPLEKTLPLYEIFPRRTPSTNT